MSSITDQVRKRFIQVLDEVRDENRDMRSNVKLAKKLRTAPPRISEWESGKGTPTYEHIYYIWKEFGKSPAFIITGEKPKEKEQITTELLDVLRRLERLEREDQKRKTA